MSLWRSGVAQLLADRNPTTLFFSASSGASADRTVAVWDQGQTLKKTAAKLGPEKSSQQPTTPGEDTRQPQSQRRKKAKAKPSVHWSQLEVLARRVADNATPDEIPDAALHILRDVRTKDSDDDKVKQRNANHAHIIGVLGRVLAKLEGLVARAPNREPKKAQGQNPRIDVFDLSNMFAFLEVQTGPDAADGDDASASAEEPKKSENQAARAAEKAADDGSWIDRVDFSMSAVDSYDSDGELDYYMMLYCYFVDFNTIRNYIWCDYWYDWSVSLYTLSVVNNAAFELFHALEIDLIQQLPRAQRGMADYDFILSTLFFDFGLEHIDYDSYDGLSKQESDERIWRDEADWLAFGSWATINWMLKGIPPGKVPHIPPSKRDPIVYGTNDMHSWHDFEESRRNPLPSFLFICGSTFANIMEKEAIHSFEQMQATATKLRETLDSQNAGKMFNAHSLKRSWAARPDEVTYLMLEDFTLENQREKFRSVGIDEEPIPFDILQNEPVWAGLLDFRAKLAESQMGHLFTMLTPEVAAAAYLYQAAAAADSGVSDWETMRQYQDTHRLDSIFGLGLMGESAQMVLKDFQQLLTTTPERLSGRLTFNHVIDIRQSLFKRYAIDNDDNFMEYIEITNRQLTSGLIATDEDDSSGVSGAAAASTDLVKYVAEKMLKLLDDTVTSQVKGILTLNYFQLYDESITLLKAMVETFGPELETRATAEGFGKPGSLGMIPKLLADDLKEADRTAREQQIVQTIIPPIGLYVFADMHFLGMQQLKLPQNQAG
ncbi:hypothetical protein B0T14DRAFT_540855 [Immersiella caudata]|uniref:DUF6604 domain-containing protein n=1 Tax=Immersiella caudata TaxID=314043 RepID=A0AA39WCX1_9PEZI|nr:hypothetical protein B0T14DRAFT_540855 [Immersiella caudata]